MKEKTLIIFMGSARVGKHAMLTQEKYFIDHLDADLALCLGDIDEIDDFLINKAKYNWNFKDFENWREYFEEHFSKNTTSGWVYSRWKTISRHNFIKPVVYLTRVCGSIFH